MNEDEIDWSLTTWEGSRREQLRRWSQLTMDAILQAQEEMADLAGRRPRDTVVVREEPPTENNR